LRKSQKMNSQKILLHNILKKISKQLSVNDAVSQALNISYDAAHRRVSGKSKFTLEETVLLCDFFKLSMDNMFLKQENIIVQKTIEINSLSEMLIYFSNSAKTISNLVSNPDTVLFYAAKDIPLFYFMDGTIISKFKAYVWLHLLEKEKKNISFEAFVIDELFLEPMLSLKKAYQKAEVHEVWNDTTINSSLQQVLYFYEAELLDYKSAMAIFKDLKRIVLSLQEKTNSTQKSFLIYYNELILLNNNLLFRSKNKLTLFVPYTLLGYFITENDEACQNVERFFMQQIQNAKPLNALGAKEKNKFFNQNLRKIDFYMEKLNFQD
jgi:hypothetical protein